MSGKKHQLQTSANFPAVDISEICPNFCVLAIASWVYSTPHSAGLSIVVVLSLLRLGLLIFSYLLYMAI